MRHFVHFSSRPLTDNEGLNRCLFSLGRGQRDPLSFVKLLVSEDADLETRNNAGSTPFRVQVRSNFELAMTSVDCIARVNAFDGRGRGALHGEINIPVDQGLLELGVGPFKVDRYTTVTVFYMK